VALSHALQHGPAAAHHRLAALPHCHVCLTRYQQAAELKAIRAELPEDAAIHSHVLQDVLARLDTTYQAFFRRVANGEKPGFPRFHGKDRYHSFTYQEYGNGARLDNGCLVLSKIGRIAVHWSRPVAGTIKTVTISKEADGWYVLFSCADVSIEPLPLTGKEPGIDVGLKVFLITADGQPVENPRHSRQAERALQKAQQRVSRRKKGSKRRRKAVRVLAKKHQHVRRQRSDFHHKTALALVRAYDTLSVEAIQPANVRRRPAPKQDEHGGYEHNGASRKAGFNKSSHDAGWRHFLSILAYKAACAGKRVDAVNPAYTSQDCSGCGERMQISLSVRTHVCTHCGLMLDRDLNAARNIFWRGQRLRGLAGLPAGLNREPVGL
jgi:putative transposase